MARVFYRIGQFWQGLWAKVTPDDLKWVAAILPPAAFPLFTQMPVDAQRHSLNVLESIEKSGERQPDLAVAALLHDCGKVAAVQGGVTLALWLRGPLVLLARIAPKLAEDWASPSPAQGWRYALYVQQEHPAIGAAWAAKAGCSPLSCWLIASHQTPAAELASADISPLEGVSSNEARRLLMLLQAADDGN